MDEEATTAEEAGWDGELQTATEGGTRKSGADGRSGDAMAGGGDTGKASSATANETGAGGRHGARLEQRGRVAGRQENPSSESLVVPVDDGGCEASGVAHESSGVGDEEGGRETSGVAKTPQGYRQGLGEVVETPQGTNTFGVA